MCCRLLATQLTSAAIGITVIQGDVAALEKRRADVQAEDRAAVVAGSLVRAAMLSQALPQGRSGSRRYRVGAYADDAHRLAVAAVFAGFEKGVHAAQARTEAARGSRKNGRGRIGLLLCCPGVPRVR
jgi:hypothetical protein